MQTNILLYARYGNPEAPHVRPLQGINLGGNMQTFFIAVPSCLVLWMVLDTWFDFYVPINEEWE